MGSTLILTILYAIPLGFALGVTRLLSSAITSGDTTSVVQCWLLGICAVGELFFFVYMRRMVARWNREPFQPEPMYRTRAEQWDLLW